MGLSLSPDHSGPGALPQQPGLGLQLLVARSGPSIRGLSPCCQEHILAISDRTRDLGRISLSFPRAFSKLPPFPPPLCLPELRLTHTHTHTHACTHARTHTHTRCSYVAEREGEKSGSVSQGKLRGIFPPSPADAQCCKLRLWSEGQGLSQSCLRCPVVGPQTHPSWPLPGPLCPGDLMLWPQCFPSHAPGLTVHFCHSLLIAWRVAEALPSPTGPSSFSPWVLGMRGGVAGEAWLELGPV